jgi:phosphoribosylamine--glycine ligase
MLTEEGPRVLEFNCRFGDPETQAILPRLTGDFLGALARAAEGALGGADLSTGPDAAVSVVLAAEGYPEAPQVGMPIRGVREAEESGAIVFHAGTALRDGELVSAGGRALGVTGLGGSIAEARDKAYAAIALIDFRGAQYRRDVALRAVRVPI